MVASRTALLIYIGFLFFIKNVLSVPLDLKEPLEGGFDVENKIENSILITEILPTSRSAITKVVNGTHLVWQPKDGQMAASVITLNSSVSPLSLMRLRVLTSYSQIFVFFEKVGDHYLQITSTTFNLLRANMKEAGQKATNLRSYQFKSTEIGEEQPSTSGATAFEEALKEAEEQMEVQDLGPVVEVQTEPKETYDPLKSLDIRDIESTSNLSVDYDILDGVGAVTIRPNKNKKIKFVFEGGVRIWEAEKHARLLYLIAYSFYGDYRLLELSYVKGEETIILYFKKLLNVWNKASAPDFEESFEGLKYRIPFIDKVNLDVANVDPNKFYTKTQIKGELKYLTYFPLPGYLIDAVGKDQRDFWRTNTKRCVAATSIVDNGEVVLITLEIVGKSNYTYKRYYAVHNGQVVEITEDSFEDFVNDPHTRARMSEFETPDRRPSGGNFDDESFDIPDDGDDVSYAYDTEGVRTLDISDPKDANVTDAVHRGIVYRSFTPLEGDIFDVVQVGDEEIWDGGPGEYTDFVRVFYPHGVPMLGFIRLIDNGNVRDHYLVRYDGKWLVVSLEMFMGLFNGYAIERPPQ